MNCWCSVIMWWLQTASSCHWKMFVGICRDALEHENRCSRQPECDSAVSVCAFPEQQDSMATTVAVSPSEYLQPATASTQVSNSQLLCSTALCSLLTTSPGLTHDAFKWLRNCRRNFVPGFEMNEPLFVCILHKLWSYSSSITNVLFLIVIISISSFTMV